MAEHIWKKASATKHLKSPSPRRDTGFDIQINFRLCCCNSNKNCRLEVANSERPRSLLLPLGVPSRPSPGSYPGPVQVPSRVRGGPVQIRHVLCFTVFRTHPGPEVGAIPARPGPIRLPSVPSSIGPGRAKLDFLATSDQSLFGGRHISNHQLWRLKLFWGGCARGIHA